jgi:hypothetical protein
MERTMMDRKRVRFILCSLHFKKIGTDERHPSQDFIRLAGLWVIH